MDRMVRVECPSGCEFCILGGEQDVLPLLWDHLVMVHHAESVSTADVMALAIAPVIQIKR